MFQYDGMSARLLKDLGNFCASLYILPIWRFFFIACWSGKGTSLVIKTLDSVLLILGTYMAALVSWCRNNTTS